MATTLDDVEAQALQLPPNERGELIHRLIVSLEGESEDSPEEIAKAWDEEIAKRVDAMERDEVEWIPAEQVFASLEKISRGKR